MADLDFLKSDNATSSDNLSFLSEKNSTTDPLSFLKEEQEIEIFGVPQKELEEGSSNLSDMDNSYHWFSKAIIDQRGKDCEDRFVEEDV